MEIARAFKGQWVKDACGKAMVFVVVLQLAQVRSLSSLAIVLVVDKGGGCRHKITKVWIERVVGE